MLKVLEHIVARDVQEMGVSAYIRRAYPTIPAFAVRDALKKRDVRVNGVRCDASALVHGGDAIKLYIDEKYVSGGLDILYQGGGLLVVEKPQGLPVDADGQGVGQDTLLARAKKQFPSARLCHRLDSGTGGAIILATDNAAYEKALAAFRDERIGKQYAMAVLGKPAQEQGRLTGYILKNAASSRVQVYDRPVPGAKTAVTDYRILDTIRKNGQDISFVHAWIHTGRTHQIRAQMAHMGCPLVGDDKYGDREKNVLLHAKMPSLWCESLSYNEQVFTSVPKFPLWKEMQK